MSGVWIVADPDPSLAFVTDPDLRDHVTIMRIRLDPDLQHGVKLCMKIPKTIVGGCQCMLYFEIVLSVQCFYVNFSTFSLTIQFSMPRQLGFEQLILVLLLLLDYTSCDSLLIDEEVFSTSSCKTLETDSDAIAKTGKPCVFPFIYKASGAQH